MVCEVCVWSHPAFPEKPSLLADIGRRGRPIRLAADARGRRQSGRFARLAVRAAAIWAKRFFGGEGRQDHLCRYAAPASRPQPLGGGSRRWLAADSGRSASRAAPWRVGAWARPCGLAPRLGLRPPSAAASPSPSLYLLDASATGADEDNAAGRSVLALHRSGSPGSLAQPRTPSRESRVGNTPSLSPKREWRRRGGKAKAEATERPMPDAGRGEVRGRFRRPADRPLRAGRRRSKRTPSG